MGGEGIHDMHTAEDLAVVEVFRVEGGRPAAGRGDDDQGIPEGEHGVAGEEDGLADEGEVVGDDRPGREVVERRERAVRAPRAGPCGSS